jgi:hypothetical protein
VRFVAARAGDHYEVVVDGQRCATPCQLDLPPGQHHITVSGAEEFSDTFELERSQGSLVTIHRHDAYVRGMIPVGIVGVLMGVAMYLGSLPLKDIECEGDHNTSCGPGNNNPPKYVLALQYGGVAVAVVSAVAAIERPTQASNVPSLHFEGMGFAPLPHSGGVVAATISF